MVPCLLERSSIILAMTGKILIGQKLSMDPLQPFLKAGVILACLRYLKICLMLPEKVSAFCFRIFTRMSLIWTALRVLTFFISLDTSSTLTHEN